MRFTVPHGSSQLTASVTPVLRDLTPSGLLRHHASTQYTDIHAKNALTHKVKTCLALFLSDLKPSVTGCGRLEIHTDQFCLRISHFRTHSHVCTKVLTPELLEPRGGLATEEGMAPNCSCRDGDPKVGFGLRTSLGWPTQNCPAISWSFCPFTGFRLSSPLGVLLASSHYLLFVVHGFPPRTSLSHSIPFCQLLFQGGELTCTLTVVT